VPEYGEFKEEEEEEEEYKVDTVLIKKR